MKNYFAENIQDIRSLFPALDRTLKEQPVVFLDGPAGSQVPRSVVARICECMFNHNANRSGRFATSHEVDGLMAQCHQDFADFVGADSPESIAFGPNMTSLTLQFSRAIAKEWKPGDRILVSNLDHDANYTPWVLAARDAGVEVKSIGINADDATLDLASLDELLNSRTKLVAVTAASNAVGSMTPIAEIAQKVHRVGGELFVDAVHMAPHRTLDVNAWDCDYLVCSAYKFYGPHIGILYGRKERMQNIQPYKLRPSPDTLPGRWMTGTQNHACIAGAAAAVRYIASHSELSPTENNLRERIVDSMQQIAEYESALIQSLIAGLAAVDGIKLFGIVDHERADERAPTIAFQMVGKKSIDVAQKLGELGIFAWHGNYYALPLTQALGTEPDGMIRLGCMHYNTLDEITRTVDTITRLV